MPCWSETLKKNRLGFIWTKLTLYWTMCRCQAECVVVQSKVNRSQEQGQWKSKMVVAAEQLKLLRMAFYADSCVVSSEDIVAVDSLVKRWRDQRKRRAETKQQLLWIGRRTEEGNVTNDSMRLIMQRKHNPAAASLNFHNRRRVTFFIIIIFFSFLVFVVACLPPLLQSIALSTTSLKNSTFSSIII